MHGGGKVKWLVVLDPVEGLVAQTDTSLAVIRQARESGIVVDTATIETLFFENRAAVIATEGSGKRQVRSLDEYSLIFMRKEPPYDLAFHYATQLLSLSKSLVVNSPAALRNFNEKLIALPFSKYMPPTLVSSDSGMIEDFLTRHGTGVIKALDSFQGKSVQKIDASDRQTVTSFTSGGKQPVMVQKFIDNVYKGDKRVMLLGDCFLGAAMRQPKQGYHANFANSEAQKTELTPREQKIIDDVAPWLLEHGIHFTGLDLIDEQLTEINITCPTGIVQIAELEGRNLAEEIVDYFSKIIQ